mgnify:CR=1 FL=1
MKLWIVIIFNLIIFSGCSLNNINSNKQVVEMGKLTGLRIIQIASVSYPESTVYPDTSLTFTEMDKINFGDSLIQSLKRSDVRVLPSAQTKIHINFIEMTLPEGVTGSKLTMVAKVAVSRNGIITRKTIEINSKSKSTLGATKSTAVKMFIQELGNLLREQSSFKR